MDILREMLLKCGADLVGYADLDALPREARQGMRYGVSIAVALDPAVTAGISEGPTPEYYAEYQRVNELLDELSASAAELLRECGHEAIPCAATDAGIDSTTHSTQLPHKTVATRAGLGWVGKTALLVTEQFGPAIRLTSVLTNAVLPTGTPVDESRCGDCTACVDSCPGHAATGADWHAGIPRDEILNAYICRSTAVENSEKRIGIPVSLCGICIAACPWTKRPVG